MKNLKRKYASIPIFFLILLLSISTISTTVESASLNEQQNLEKFKVQAPLYNNEVDFKSEIPKVNKDSGISIEKPDFSVSSNFDVSGDRMNFNDSLTSSDPDDFWFFSIPSDRSILFEIETENPDYIVELYQIDWETGTAYPTSIGGYANQLVANNQITSGDWALRVYSSNTLEDTYTIKMNATNPNGAESVYSTSDSLLYAVLGYPNGDIYSNGVFVAAIGRENTQLDWEREFYFAWDGNYNQRQHSISDVNIKSISAPVSYTASYASSNNAILLYLDEGSLFTHHVSSFRSGPPTQYDSSFVDTIGKTTPRRLDTDDLTNWGDHILVFDLNTGESIDFFSVLNYYYASGAESIPTITFLN
ncbi:MULTISPECIES: hypothetical protein [Sediminibacillus]|uniref:hypothetical protein n=1 Tax=Sediminibacillus TaxID=482460 RepID=UPI0012978CA4|nr:hypothetical protein [Sediminibacillus terrae]